MASEAQKKASEKYDKKNTRNIMFKFNLKNDADILKKLDSVDNRQGYIKMLIRNDMNKQAEAPTPTITKTIIEGEFKDGESVTVSIDGREFKRKVYHSSKLNDLAIVIFNNEYGKSEFIKAGE